MLRGDWPIPGSRVSVPHASHSHLQLHESPGQHRRLGAITAAPIRCMSQMLAPSAITRQGEKEEEPHSHHRHQLACTGRAQKLADKHSIPRCTQRLTNSPPETRLKAAATRNKEAINRLVTQQLGTSQTGCSTHVKQTACPVALPTFVLSTTPARHRRSSTSAAMSTAVALADTRLTALLLSSGRPAIRNVCMRMPAA